METIVCLSGQHREMLHQVTEYFNIQADLHLDLMETNQTLAGFAARCIRGIDAALEEHVPHCVVVQGDTSTVMSASLAAFYRQVPLVHVEAGLRSGDLQAPWPEEMNRRVTSLVTSLHCAPTQQAAENLLREGHCSKTVHVTGNTVIDALMWTVLRERDKDSRWREKYSFLADRTMVLITGHRRENFGQGFRDVCQAILRLSRRFPEVEFLYPVHLNPNVQDPVHSVLGNNPNIHLREPVPYPEFVWLMDRSKLILSDSGGVQEEAPSLKKPVLVMRDSTERPEAIEAGAVELVGTSIPLIFDRCSALLSDPDEYSRHQIGTNPYGDGRSAPRIVDLMLLQGWHQ
jgi:UDP-N-acetylglucosamine 2-epimerase (non-hydrolysing)